MNTLTLIRKQIQKAAAVHDAQITHTAYRGVEYDQRCVENKESHGTFCYRGRTYTKCCLLYTSPSPRDYAASRMPSSA